MAIMDAPMRWGLGLWLPCAGAGADDPCLMHVLSHGLYACMHRIFVLVLVMPADHAHAWGAGIGGADQ